MRRAVLALAFLAACASSTPWVGKPVAELYSKEGPPDQVIDDPACVGCKMHIYVRTRQAVQKLAPIGDNPPLEFVRTRTRKAIYYADTSGVITKMERR